MGVVILVAWIERRGSDRLGPISRRILRGAPAPR
jgi:hypothetical protein